MHTPDGPLSATEKSQRLGGWLVLVLLFAMLCGPYLIGFAPAGGDLVNQYIPYQHMIRQAVRAGELPLWNSWTFCGRPLMADIQVGVLYPPNWLHWLLPLPLSFALLLAGHMAWMIAGCWRLGRRLDLSPPAAALGTVLFCASPFFMLKLSQGIVLFIYVGSWWPWLALGAVGLARRPCFNRLAALTVGIALSLLAGAPQITFYGWLLTLAVGLTVRAEPSFGALDEGNAASGVRGWVRRGLWLGAAFVLAGGLVAWQAAQTWCFISTSFERGTGASWEYITDGSLQPRHLWLLLSPGFLGLGQDPGYYWGSRTDFAETCFYAPLWALVTLAPLAWAAAFAWGEGVCPAGRRRLTWLATAGLVLGVGLALGQYSPLFKAFYAVVPGFNKFRVPARLMTLAVAGGAFLAAAGLDGLLRSPRRLGKGWLALAAVLTLGALGGVWGSYLMRGPLWAALGNPVVGPGGAVALQARPAFNVMSAHALGMVVRVSVFLLAGAAGVGALALARGPLGRGRRWIPWGLGVLAAAELAALAMPFHRLCWIPKFTQTFYPQTTLVQTLQREHRGGRVLWLDTVHSWQYDQNQPEIYPNRLCMNGLPEARGYDPVNARWLGVWFNLLAGMDPAQNPRGFMFLPQLARPIWLALMGVETVLSYQSLEGTPGLQQAAVLDFPAGEDHPAGRLFVYRNTLYKGLAFAAPAPRLLPPEKVLPADFKQKSVLASAQVADEAQDKASLQGILLTHAYALAGLDKTPPAQAVDASFKVTPGPQGNHRMEYEVDFPAPALLWLAQSSYEGWAAQVDGERWPLAWGNGAWLCTAIPAGAHRVVFDYLPMGFVVGRLVSLMSLVILAYGLVRARLLLRKKRAQE